LHTTTNIHMYLEHFLFSIFSTLNKLKIKVADKSMIRFLKYLSMIFIHAILNMLYNLVELNGVAQQEVPIWNCSMIMQVVFLKLAYKRLGTKLNMHRASLVFSRSEIMELKAMRETITLAILLSLLLGQSLGSYNSCYHNCYTDCRQREPSHAVCKTMCFLTCVGKHSSNKIHGDCNINCVKSSCLHLNPSKTTIPAKFMHVVIYILFCLSN